jgi:hypothetical protein
MEIDEQESAGSVPHVHPEIGDAPARARNRSWRRVLQVGVGVGVAAGVAVGATALASAASSSNGPTSKTTPPSSSTHPNFPHGAGGRGFGGRGFGSGGFGGGFGGFGAFGQVLHGEGTIKGPNGYETIEVQTGTVTTVKDVSGSTWSMTVTSADKTALTYVVDSGSTVNGGETGISAVKSGDTVNVLAVVSKGTATVKTLIDSTQLKANRTSWAPPNQGAPGLMPNGPTTPTTAAPTGYIN